MAYVLALGSAALYGAADFLGGLASRRASTIAIVLVSQASGLALLLLLLPALPAGSPAPRDLAWGAIAGFTGGAGVALLYRALAIGTMAVVAPTTAVCAVVIPVAAGILMGERLSPRTSMGIVTALVAIVLVSRTRRSGDGGGRAAGGPVLPPGVGLALLSGVAIGLFYLALARTAADAGLWPLVSARLVSTALFGSMAAARALTLRIPPGVAAMAVAGGALDMAANALYLVASRAGPLSVVVTLSSLYPASTVLLARVALGERLHPWQWAGVGCALVAVVLIVSP